MLNTVFHPLRAAIGAVASAAVLASSVVLPAAPAQAQSPGNLSNVDEFVTRMIDLYGVAGVSIALVQDGKVVYVKGYGVRSTETQAPVTADTEFAIGSITKSFTGLALMQLAEQGKVDLDAPVATYLPGFRLADEESTQSVTVRNLISHASGLPRADDRWYGMGLTREEIVADMVNVEPTAKPGELWQYHNQNFVAAGLIVERVTGQSWEEYTRQHLLQPLGMRTAGFGAAELERAPNAAAPHVVDIWQALNSFHGQVPIPFGSPGLRSLEAVGPAGSIVASAREMGEYARFQVGDGRLDGRRIVSAQGLEETHRPQVRIAAAFDGSPYEEQSYGFGWVVESYQDHRLLQHSGGIDGYSAMITLAPDDDDGVVILSNANGNGLFLEAMRIGLIERLLGITGEYEFADIINQVGGYDPAVRREQYDALLTYQADPADLDRIVGTYETDIGLATITFEGGLAYIELPGLGKAPLAAFEPLQFFIDGSLFSGTQIGFQALPDGGMLLLSDGRPIGQRQ